MSIYYSVFIWLVIMVFISQQKNVIYETIIEGERVQRWKVFYAILAFTPVIYLVVFTIPRSDTVLYLSVYRNLPTSFMGLLENIRTTESGQGFIVFEWIISRIFRGNETAFRFLLALLHSIPILYIFRKYSENYLMSLYLFVATGCHLAWMMNGLRQFLAVSLIITATPLMLKKRYMSLIAIVLLASTIHTSALIMLPVIFIVQGEPWNKKTLVFILLSVIMMYLFSRYTGLLDSMLSNTEYSGVMKNAAEMGDDGTNPIRVLVNSIPVIMAWIGRKIISEENNLVINLCVNMSIITTCIYLISMVTSGIMLGRLPIYTSLYSLILLPYIIKKIFTPQSCKLVYLAMIGLYFVYYLYAYRGF